MTMTNLKRMLLLCSLLCGSKFLVSAQEEKEEFTPPTVVSSIQNDLEFDENQKLASHYLVFPADRPDCATNSFLSSGGESVYGYDMRPVAGDALATIFPHYGTGKSYLGRDPDNEFELEEGQDDNRCLAACLEKGTDIKVAGHTMPHFHYNDNNNDQSTKPSAFQKKAEFDNWFLNTCKRVEVCLINYVVKERPLEVFWINFQGKPQKQFDVDFSERKTQCFHSFIGHKFVAIDEPTGFHQEITIEHATTMAFGTSPPSSSQRFDGIEEVESSVKDALKVEWKKHKKVERTFSSLGFAKGRLPDDVFANMAAFYYNNRNNVVNEEWEGKGVFVNWWETDVKFVAIPWDIKKKWQLRLMELVSDWAGVPVEETSMYGLRQYETGARLLSHVDRLPTHAVSLIVNIAQTNLASPWPVEVFDHADRLHEINMEEGDIVYYESAKNLHSRNRPLSCKPGGCAFINLFTHYRPVNDGSQWHRNLKDMPNRPPPLLDGQVAFDQNSESCKPTTNLAANSNNSSTDNFLGVGHVDCEDSKLGSFLSPTLFRLKEEADLFRWWKATADGNLIGFDDQGEALYRDPDTNEEYYRSEDEDQYYTDEEDEEEEDGEL